MSANTQDFRVKHGLQVTEGATFSNTVSVSGNVTISDKSLVITGPQALNINAVGRSEFGNTLTVSNGGIVVSNGGFTATAANSSSTTTLLISNGGISITGNLTVSGSTTLNTSATFTIGTGELVLYDGFQGSPTTNANIEINRGVANTVSIRWDEVNDQWKFSNDGVFYYPFRTYSSLVYQFSTTTTTNADPGDGIVRFNNATYNLVTEIAIDRLEQGGTNVTNIIDLLDDNNGTDKAFIFFRSAQNPSKFVSYKITGNVNATDSGYRRLTVVHLSGGTSTFDNNEIVFFEIGGIIGSTGPQGPQGRQGPQGFQGLTGPQGPQGNQGPQGFQGLTGPQGPQGNQGPQGPQGAQGPQGNQGTMGPQGTGPQGVAGPQGTTGAAGGSLAPGYLLTSTLTGTNNATPTDRDFFTNQSIVNNTTVFKIHKNDFITNNDLSIRFDLLIGRLFTLVVYEGINITTAVPDYSKVLYFNCTQIVDSGDFYTLTVSFGSKSAAASGTWTGGAYYGFAVPGATGPQGFQGPQGTQGTLGSTGPQGPQGAQGPQGNQGTMGPQGTLGPTGPQGPQGTQGPTGTVGPQGPQGFGSTGPQGPQGAAGGGPQGPQGFGPQGPQGRQGSTGPQGPTGSQGSSAGTLGSMEILWQQVITSTSQWAKPANTASGGAFNNDDTIVAILIGGGGSGGALRIADGFEGTYAIATGGGGGGVAVGTFKWDSILNNIQGSNPINSPNQFYATEAIVGAGGAAASTEGAYIPVGGDARSGRGGIGNSGGDTVFLGLKASGGTGGHIATNLDPNGSFWTLVVTSGASLVSAGVGGGPIISQGAASSLVTPAGDDVIIKNGGNGRLPAPALAASISQLYANPFVSFNTVAPLNTRTGIPDGLTGGGGSSALGRNTAYVWADTTDVNRAGNVNVLFGAGGAGRPVSQVASVESGTTPGGGGAGALGFHGFNQQVQRFSGAGARGEIRLYVVRGRVDAWLASQNLFHPTRSISSGI